MKLTPRLSVSIATCIALASIVPTYVHAEPMFDSNAECSLPNWTGWPEMDGRARNPVPLAGYDPGDAIYFYIQEDFGTQLQQCLDTDTGNNSEIKDIAADDVDAAVGSIIQAAAETWNLESRGAALVFGGYLDASSADEACSQMQKPALFVRFRPGCLRVPGATTCFNTPNLSGGSNATVNAQYVFSCDNAAELTMWGDINSMPLFNACDPTIASGFTGIQEWGVDGEGDLFDLKSLMIHEFGHVVDLGHLGTGNPALSASVMNFGRGGANEIARGRHLWPWDADCADDPAPAPSHRGERNVVYHWLGFDSDGNPEPVKSGGTTNRGFMSGGHTELNNSPSRLLKNFAGAP